MNTFSLDSKIDRTLTVKGKIYHYFSGTSYLGIGQSPEFQEELIRGMEQYGLNHGLSRINNVRLSIYEKFEEAFAKQAEAENAIVMSSGYLAGMTALQYLSDKCDQIWVAPDTHPAILPLDLKPDPKTSFDSWMQSCLEKSRKMPSQKILILGNAVNPMIPEIHSYDWVAQLAEKHEVTLLIDDSHAFGVIGKSVFGTYYQWKDLPINLLVSGSLGKGLGLPAGIILCNEKTAENIRKLPIYGGASPCPPAYLHAFLKSKELYREQKSRLMQLIKYFEKKNEIPEHIYGIKNYPVFSYRPETWVEKLEAKKIITSSFPYPTSKDKSVNRIILSSFHTAEDIDSLWAHIKEIYQR
ncbi:aminotransferase class I/II-fold pyridoxal phosphate-dependent enzyme [Algoriphagus pacificus]|uniref:Aminotransferase class I/II-fold pyridoxal phosphate-dependent enzyme n=1 Tax=Algoriphagus pacificus TaxID=2811234 RepID=A0ABS3CCS9_9BACT|nr:aminotransferase class I/II-fold pyridoxal phosphate-dependent enzyme [Algoriphagus pacificus]MBN7814349.1 aminotransferase class I/II-fold pyridoxal phosphate-dependent enzyme [Algoriphagus pacificus]